MTSAVSEVTGDKFSGCLAASCHGYRTCHGKGLYCVNVVICWKFLEFLGISGLQGHKSVARLGVKVLKSNGRKKQENKI